MTSNLLSRVPSPWRKRFAELGRMAGARGLSLCLVGGCVRDLLLRRAPLDWDVAGEGSLEEFVREAAKAFSAGLVEHPAFLTFTFHFPDGTSLDAATARRETYASPAALPAVSPGALADDFARRDFTANALAVGLTPDRWGELLDPFHGRADIARGLVRALHAKSFEDDPTRAHRAARYAGRCGWTVEPNTLNWIKACAAAGHPARLSPARLRNELEKILQEEDPRPALKLLRSWGFWRFWNPAWKWSPFLDKALAPGKVFRPAAGRGAKADRTLFRLLALCRGSAPEAAAQDLAALAFPRAVWDAAQRALSILRDLNARRLPADVPPAAQAATVEAFLSFAAKDKAAFKRWKSAAPLISGEDLRALGHAPGPLYQEIFSSLARARWTGRVKTRPQERRHVIDNFPLKK
jgi:tRNA nucleotidyltransferase (CCA-adding enzyme)